MPEVSVVMSCYNEQAHVSKAIESILSQSFEDFEFVIIDDGSSDKTLSIIKDFQKGDSRIKFIVNSKNQGLASSLNKGVQDATGKYIARMDADDIAFPRRLELQVAFLNENSEVDILGSNAKMIKGSDSWTSTVPLQHQEIAKSLYTQTSIIHPTVMMKKSCFDPEGYDPTLPWAEDKDLWLRWNDKFTFANLSESLIQYTVKERITWRIFYYNHWVLIKNMQKQGVLISKLPTVLKSIMSHLLKMIRF